MNALSLPQVLRSLLSSPNCGVCGQQQVLGTEESKAGLSISTALMEAVCQWRGCKWLEWGQRAQGQQKEQPTFIRWCWTTEKAESPSLMFWVELREAPPSTTAGLTFPLHLSSDELTTCPRRSIQTNSGLASLLPLPVNLVPSA